MRRRHYSGIRAAALILVLMLSRAALRADININFQSIFEANNTQSDGSPMDASFTFEFGSFSDSFVPLESNLSEWMDHWVVSPNSNNSEFSGPAVPYSTDNVPFGGPANAFQGFVTLNSNEDPFTGDDHGYFWGYTEREEIGSSEWVLLSNPSWLFPIVAPGEIETGEVNWLTGDSGTYAVIGSVNPDYDTGVPAGSQAPHMSSSLVNIAWPVPEPSVGALALLSLALAGARRRSN